MSEAVYNFSKIDKPTKNSFRSYNGIYYDGKQIIFSKACDFAHAVVDIYVDSQAEAIRLQIGTEFKRNKSNRISVSGLKVPKGRYDKVEESNGTIYRKVRTNP
jgi:hypothetical protein